MRIHLRYITVLLSLVFAQLGKAQLVDAPEFSCVQVANNGYALLGWTPPTDPGANFVAYHIWRANNYTGPYLEVTALSNLSDNGYTHATVTPLTSNICYYVVTESTDGVVNYFSATSDTLCTISLDAVPSVSPLGYAELHWTQPYLNPPAGVSYEIQMEYPTGVWNTVSNQPWGVNALDYEISVCDEFLNFRVIVTDPSGCVFNSDIAGGQFEDHTPPAIPVINSVSIDPATNDAVVDWEPSTSPDTQGYILYTCNGSSINLRDTIWGYDNTQWTDLTINTLTGPVCYLIAAIDTCYTGIPPSPNTSPTADVCNCSIYLDPVAYAICDDFVNLSWSAYSGWEDGVDHYNIYHQVDGGPVELIGTVPGTELTFVHTFNNIISGNHGYYIEGVAATTGYLAQSNLRNVAIVYPAEPAYTYLSAANVNEAGMLEGKFAIENTPTEHFIYLERLRLSDASWVDVNSSSNFGNTSVIIEDPAAQTDVFSYTYRAIVRNICGNVVDTTNLGVSMLLQGVVSEGVAENVLNWTPYGGWENGVYNYRIWRKIGQNGAWEVLTDVESTRRYYKDELLDLNNTPGEFCYRIEAIEIANSVPGSPFSAFSNTVCLVQEPRIWVPNAFVVDGFNRTFFPVISFAELNEYRMIIYSKWGDVIFDTDDINTHWDGTMHNKPVQEGVYVYYISIEDGKGRPYEIRGKVTLLSERDQ